MNNQNSIKDYISYALLTNGLGVLATESDGQPHASLVAVSPMDDFIHLIFATYRNNCKYKTLINNGKVAILFENRSTLGLNQPNISVLTAFGYAKEIDIAVSDAFRNFHLLRHPELDSFLLSSDCSIFQVKVNAYQMVSGIDDVKWWNITDYMLNK
jgi:hypothetical protein